MIANIVYGVGYTAARVFYFPNQSDLRDRIRTQVLNHNVCQPGSKLYTKFTDPVNNAWFTHLNSDLTTAEKNWLKAATVLRYMQIGVDLIAIVIFSVNPMSLLGYVASPVLGPLWNIAVPVAMCALGFVSPIFLIVPVVQAVFHLAPNLIEWYIIGSDVQKLENCLSETVQGYKLSMPALHNPSYFESVGASVRGIPSLIAEGVKSVFRHQNDNTIIKLSNLVSAISSYENRDVMHYGKQAADDLALL